ncbi:DUF2974 domain-containing protein [Bacillus timonensis]|uniref:DUF2974 domain-containing protein n=1 Tax=Bacillus timonensis TaxID=1033734 RepID=A0A4S3PU54_9BACI|nr:Mbeg1-like protein [Bacillus timonensis]THE12422.1 DUF2974 domain-containing protein [Bacillus timonensis]
MSLTNLNDEEKNILLMLSYLDLPPDADVEGKSMEQIWNIANKIPNNGGKVRYEKLEEFFNTKYDSSALSDVHLKQYQNFNPNDGNNSSGRSSSGFVGYAWGDSQDNASAVFRGSEDMKDQAHFDTDWISNFEAGVGIEIQQQREANEFYQQFVKGVNGEILLLGHSKGGNLATYVYVNNLEDKVGAYVLNGAPIYWYSLTKEQKEALLGDRYMFVVYEGDVVSQAGYAPYVDKIVKIDKDALEYLGEMKDPFYPHYETSVEFNDKGEFKHFEEGSSLVRDVSSTIMLKLSKLIEVVKATYPVAKAIADATIRVIHSIKSGIEAAAHFIKEQVIKYAKKAMQVAIGTVKAIGDYFDNLIKDVTSFFVNVIKKLGGYFPVEPYLKVNIDRLYYYAQRLEAIKRRVSVLNDKIDSLYWEVDLLDIRHVLSADILTSFSYRLNQNINYLNAAARLLDSNETKLVGKARIIR